MPGIAGLTRDQVKDDELDDDLARELMADYLSGEFWLHYFKG